METNTMISWPLRTSIIAMLISCQLAAETHKLPTLELGVAMYSLTAPQYRGSAYTSNYLLPAPYIKYRGDKLKVDDGIESLLPLSDNLILSISANATLPSENDNPERQGMEKLKASAEIGPSLEYRLHRELRDSIWLELPLRFGVTIEQSPRDIGYVIHPRLAWRKTPTRKGEWKFRLAAGPLYSSQRYHDYYYSVPAISAQPQRPEYQAESGYSGLRSDFTFSKRHGDYWYGGFVRYDSLTHSVIEDSPLVSETSVWMAGIGLSWVFSETY